MTKELSRAEQIRRERQERGVDVLSGTRMRLPKPQPKPGWHRRYVNDDADRIGRMMELGYTIVADRDGGLSDKTGMGAEVSAFAGTKASGSAMRAVLMEIPEEIYQEDRRAKHRAIEETEAGIKSGNLADDKGADASDRRAFSGSMKVSAEG